MSELMPPRDAAIFEKALPFLDVRSNDVHTLNAYTIARALLPMVTGADEAVSLPAVLLHDTGWKRIPADKILYAFGPRKKYPELERQHEIEGAAIAREILAELGSVADVEAVVAIIDGHDTRKVALTPSDAVMKDADKIWRLTPHGLATIAGWFELDPAETLTIVKPHVLPFLLTDAGRVMAAGFVAAAEAATSSDMAKLAQPNGK